MHSSIAVVFGVVAFCTLLDARSVGPYEGQYWPFAIPHRAARADADDVPKRTCGLVLVKLTKQICGEECAPPGMIPLELIDGTEQEPQRRKRMSKCFVQWLARTVTERTVRLTQLARRYHGQL